eukprot:TRINITY_DN65895_c11_g3_i1.p2 TRINITY_DN65895_c11_g3~~TRINITY_DN65895_c11_g3_i1.p2  ORF type:complete len:305 (+),score=35.24 TRINITY_DN65895_c11_g3_i1:1703-2617(+)
MDTSEGTLTEGTPAKPRKFKKVDLKVTTIIPNMLSKEQIHDANELEVKMAFEDQLIKETSDKRNELESYIYSMRSKLDGNLKEFGSPDDVTTMKNLINEAEEWLYSDEGYDTTKSKYAKKLEDLLIPGKKFESRLWEDNHRPEAIQQLKTQIERCRTFAQQRDEAHEHITDDDRIAIRKECEDAEAWMYDMMGKQGELQKYNDPILTVASINTHRQQLFSKTNPIITKPKPKPKPATPPPTTENNTTNTEEKPTPMDQDNNDSNENNENADEKKMDEDNNDTNNETNNDENKDNVPMDTESETV